MRENIDRDACNIRHHINSSYCSLWWKPHDPRITTPYTFHFLTPTFFLLCRHKLWPPKSVIHPTNTNIGTFYFSIFTTIQLTSNFLKLPRSYQYNYEYFLLNFTDILIFTNTIVWTLCFLFVNIIVKFFTCLLVWFATLCLSFPCNYTFDITILICLLGDKNGCIWDLHHSTYQLIQTFEVFAGSFGYHYWSCIGKTREWVERKMLMLELSLSISTDITVTTQHLTWFPFVYIQQLARNGSKRREELADRDWLFNWFSCNVTCYQLLPHISAVI